MIRTTCSRTSSDCKRLTKHKGWHDRGHPDSEESLHQARKRTQISLAQSAKVVLGAQDGLELVKSVFDGVEVGLNVGR
jgi:hypothetical protein